MKNFSEKLLFLLCFIVSGITTGYSQENASWPAFHGSDRLNKSTETGLLNAWPEAGPSQAWKITGIGEGYSSVAIADGLIFTSGKSENQTYVFAFDMNGKLVWKKPNGVRLTSSSAHTGFSPRMLDSKTSGCL